MTITTRDQSVPQAPELTVTVVRLEHTGHVLAALTRATTGPPPAVRLLTQSAFPLAVPGASGLVLVPAELLTTEQLGAPRDILAAPWRWYVDTGGEQAAAPATPQLKPVSCPAPPSASPKDRSTSRPPPPTARPPSSRWSIRPPSGAPAAPSASRSATPSARTEQPCWAMAMSRRATKPWSSSGGGRWPCTPRARSTDGDPRRDEARTQV